MTNQYYNFLDKIFNYKDKIKYFEIDFTKPWLTQTILRKPFLLSISLISEIIQSIFLTLIPLSIGYIFDTRKYEYLWVFFGTYILIELLNRVTWQQHTYQIALNRGSLLVSANKFLLTTDPINHTFRSSGQIISKITKSTEALEQIFFIFIDDLILIVTGLVTLIITFLSVDRSLGLICLISIAVIASANIYLSFFNSKNLKPITMKAEDDISKTYTEGLMSVHYIRSTFATDSFYHKIKAKAITNDTVIATSEMGYALSSSLIRTLYGISFLILGLFILQLINNNQLGNGIGLGIFIIYVGQLSAIRAVGRLTQKIIESNIRLTDFFKFITNFGKQTYPVLK